MNDNNFFLVSYFKLTSEVNRERLFQVVQKWFDYFGVPIERRTGAKGNIIQYNYDKTFNTFFNKTDSCAFYSGNSTTQTEYQMYEWLIFTNIDFEAGEIILSADKTLITKNIIDILLPIINELNVYYGYAFFDKKINGLHYAIGVPFYNVDDDFNEHHEMAEKVSKWRNALDDKKILSKFRNIYQYNFFSLSSFKFQISGLSLIEWIKSKSYGEISVINKKVVLWTLVKNEIPTVREEFILHNRIWES